jgi:hypothetical protein
VAVRPCTTRPTRAELSQSYKGLNCRRFGSVLLLQAILELSDVEGCLDPQDLNKRK